MITRCSSIRTSLLGGSGSSTSCQRILVPGARPRYQSTSNRQSPAALATADSSSSTSSSASSYSSGSASSSSSTSPRSSSSDSSSSASSPWTYTPPPPLFAPSIADDYLFKAHFDHPQPLSPSYRNSDTTPGLFLLAPLTSPSALPSLTDRTLVHAQVLVDRICSAAQDASGKEVRLVVKNLDRLSDLLCGVIDLCELVRNVHPEEEWVTECDTTYERLCSFMNGLNTDRGLYLALVATLEYPHAEPLSTAETQVALTFLRDFEKSGIHLPPAVRARFVELSDKLLSLGRTFLSSASLPPSPQPLIELPDPDKLLAGMGAQFIDSLPHRKGIALVVPGSWEAQMIGRYAREGEARRLVYEGGMKIEPKRVKVLEDMLSSRAELAGVLGKETWGDVVLTDKMAKNPTNVKGFLNSLAAHHRPTAAADIATLQRVKATALTGNKYPINSEHNAHLPQLYVWDRDFYSEKYLTTLSQSASLPPIPPYFSTGTALLGLSRLFSKLYGISFRPASLAFGEAWHPSVRKLDVMDETDGQIGTIYCDLFSREGKPPSAAHYTVRCSRRVDDDDTQGDDLPVGWDANYGPGLETEGVRIRGKEGKYQLPIVVLTTDFGQVEEGRPALLGWSDLETLFHEMGHAIHSMIGRTEYHNVSGTRCATDFVELPSILMEHFVSSPSVLSLFATHHSTGEPLPIPLIQSHLAIQQSLAAVETHGQILMALLDQAYHSLTLDQIRSTGLDSTGIYNDLQRRVGVIPPVEGTAWQTQFGHLYGYGATYYSYLFDRAIAGKVWKTLFSDQSNLGDGGKGGLSREGGQVLKEKVLKWGGGRDPWEMVGDVVGGKEGEAVARGDEKAMGLVGGWLLK